MNQNPSIPIEEQLKINDEFSQIREDEFNFNGLAKYINELKVNEEIISMHVNILNIRIRISKNNYVQTVLELVNSGLVPYLIELYRKQITIQLSADIECTILIQLEILTIMAATNFEKVEFNFKAKVIQFFIDLLKDKDFSMQEVAIQGLANIFAENIQLKKIAINQGAIEGIFEILKSNDSLQLQKNCLSVLENLYLTVAALQNYSSKNCLSIICSALHTLDDEESHCKLLSILTHHFIGSSIVMQSAEIIQFNLISKLIEFLDNNNQQISCLAQDSLFKIVEVNNINHEFDDQLLSSNLLNKIPKLLQTKYNNEVIQ